MASHRRAGRLRFLPGCNKEIPRARVVWRMLRTAVQAAYRGRAKTPHKTGPPATDVATALRQAWCWDMIYPPASATIQVSK